jgi:hypothetical protein
MRMKTLLVITLFALPLAAAGLQGPGAPKSPDTPKQKRHPIDNDCEDVGVEWVNPHVAAAGGSVCTGDEFDLTIGYDNFGVGVTFHAIGCPSYVIIEPGHWAPVQKNGYYISNSMFRNGVKSYYECDTWGKNSCEPSDKPDESDPSFGATSYEAMACPN